MSNRFGKYLKNKRTSNGLSLRDVEAKCNISNAYLSQIERGKRNVPTIKYLIRLAAAYSINIHDLINVIMIDQFNDHGAGI